MQCPAGTYGTVIGLNTSDCSGSCPVGYDFTFKNRNSCFHCIHVLVNFRLFLNISVHIVRSVPLIQFHVRRGRMDQSRAFKLLPVLESAGMKFEHLLLSTLLFSLYCLFYYKIL